MKDEIEIFLKSPIAFTGGWSTSNSTIQGLTLGNEGVRVNGKIEPPVGPLIGWGSELSTRNRYYYGSSSNSMTRREIEDFEKNGNEVQFKITQVENFKTPGYKNYYNNDVGNFAEIIQRDQRTMAFLENIPGLEDKFKKFVNDTMQWWVHNEETVAMWQAHNNNRPTMFIQSNQSPMVNELCEINDLITKENAAKLEEQLYAVLETGTEEGVATYDVETFAKLGIKNGPGSTFLYQQRPRGGQGATERGPYEDSNLIPVSEDLGVLSSWKTDDQKKAKSMKTSYYTKSGVSKYSDFTGNFVINPEIDYKIYARFAWKKVKYAHEQTVTKTRRLSWQGTRRTEHNRTTINHWMYLPVVESLCLEILPPKGTKVNPPYTIQGLSPSYAAGLRTSEESGWSMDRIQRVRDATKKRASKGGYKGSYQGIETLRAGSTDVFAFITKSNFSDIAGAPAIRDYTANVSELARTIPLKMEQYLEIERPEVDVKPVEIGHLDFLRLSDPPKRLVVGETLSDLLLPSMPALIIAVDTDMKVTSGENYVTGELCSGSCSKAETVDINLNPGLYLVVRKAKCSLGHDPGRSEYTAGFGEICNEIITIRNMLSQLNIAYDEFRGNMVGTSKSNKFAETKIDSGAFLGRLG